MSDVSCLRATFCRPSSSFVVFCKMPTIDILLSISAVVFAVFGILAVIKMFPMSPFDPSTQACIMFGGAAICFATVIIKQVLTHRKMCCFGPYRTPLELEAELSEIDRVAFDNAFYYGSDWNECTVNFKNGKCARVTLTGREAYLLIQAIGKEKCPRFPEDGISPDIGFASYEANLDQKANLDEIVDNILDRTKRSSGERLSQIKYLTFAECNNANPCQHACTISFQNNKELSTTLNGYEAFLLIRAIGEEKCSLLPDNKLTKRRHFDRYSYNRNEYLEKVLDKIFASDEWK